MSVSRPKWPKWLRSDKSKSKDPGKRGGSQLNGTGRIVRQAIRQAADPPPPVAPDKPTKTDVRRHDTVVHVNFNKTSVLVGRFEVIDPVTKRKKTTRRFNKSDVFYYKDGVLYDGFGPIPD